MQQTKEIETELRVLRNEREQFVEMNVRMEIQTKELGMIMRDQQKVMQAKNSPKAKSVKGKVSPAGSVSSGNK